MIQVSEWGCEKGDVVIITMNARAGSKFGHREGVQARGTVRAEIGDEPDGYNG